MVTRRDVASIVGLGAVTAAALAAPAVAQTAADPNESTFARIRRTKKMRIGAVGGGAPYYMDAPRLWACCGRIFSISGKSAPEMEQSSSND